MTNFKTLTTTTITTAALFAAPAFAQDTAQDASQEAPWIEVAPDASLSHFASADLDQDGELNSDEFVTFAVMQAESGNETFKDIVISGEYSTTFAAHDTDASGGISAEELGHGDTPAEESSDEMMSDDMDSEDAPMDAPEVN